MSKSHCISGVNWASVKKFARFTFGEKNVLSNRVVDNGKHYIIYLDKKIYWENKSIVDKFEDAFLINLKPME